jgi:hypothetical protein
VQSEQLCWLIEVRRGEASRAAAPQHSCSQQATAGAVSRSVHNTEGGTCCSRLNEQWCRCWRCRVCCAAHLLCH